MTRRPRGFSVLELVLLLAALLLVAFGMLDLVDRRTRLEAPSVDELDRTLRAASPLLERAVRTAGAGGVSQGLEIGDNAGDGSAFATRASTVAVRPGTDRLRVRGVLESPLVALAAEDALTREPVSSPVDSASPGLLQRNPTDAPLRVPLRSGSDAGRVLALATRVRTALAEKESVFFLIRDDRGGSAAGRVKSADEQGLTDDCLAAPPSDIAASAACHLELRLDLTDAGAAAWNPGGDPRAWERLGPAFEGGLLDDETFFVARGEAGPGGERDLPHPYLALARSLGGETHEVQRLADEVEDLQIAWRDEAGGFTPETPGETAPAPPFPAMLKIALVAKSAAPVRVPSGAWTSRAPSGLGGILLMNAPRPGASSAAPVGFARELERRVPFARRASIVEVAPRNLRRPEPTP